MLLRHSRQIVLWGACLVSSLAFAAMNDGPGSGGGYGSLRQGDDDGPGVGGGYGAWHLADGPGLGGGYGPLLSDDGPGLGGGYGKLLQV